MHSSDFYKSRLKQLPAVADWAKDQALQTMDWLNTELADRPYIAGDTYTMADIVAQCAFVLGKAAGVRIPPEMTHLTRWFATVSARPTARA
jgi:glutathione S-transferase